MATKKGTPTHNGLGRKVNKGRGGCPASKQPKSGKGRNRK